MSIINENYLLVINNLTLKLQNNLILSSVFFKLRKNESIAILGSSGSGKTTFLRSIAGFIRKFDNGDIFLDNRLVQSDHIFESPEKRNCALLFQDLALWPHLTVLEHLKLTSYSAYKNNFYNLLEFFHLTEHIHKFPYQLSGGEKQRLAFARILIIKPLLVLLDEPFSSVDLVLKSKMIKMLKKLKDKFKFSLLHVTHDVNEAIYLGDRIVLFNNGKISWDGKTKNFLISKSSILKNIQVAYSCIYENISF